MSTLIVEGGRSPRWSIGVAGVHRRQSPVRRSHGETVAPADPHRPLLIGRRSISENPPNSSPPAWALP